MSACVRQTRFQRHCPFEYTEHRYRLPAALRPYQPCSESGQYAPGTTDPLWVWVADGFGLGADVEARGFGLDGFGTGLGDADGLTATTVTDVGDGATSVEALPVGDAAKAAGRSSDEFEALSLSGSVPMMPPVRQTAITAPTMMMMRQFGFGRGGEGCMPAAYKRAARA